MNQTPIDPSAMADSLVKEGGPPSSDAEGSPLRRCPQCKNQLPEAAFYKSRTDKPTCYCKACVRKRQRDYRARYPDKVRASLAGWYQRNVEKQRSYRQNYYVEHHERILERDHIYRTNNRARLRMRQRSYRAQHLEAENHRARQWRKTNKARALISIKAWQKKHPQAVTSYGQCRRARKLAAPGASYTSAELVRWRWEMWGERCYICGAPAVATDHVIALSRGGSHWPSNLRPICNPCNSSKHKHSLQEFLRRTRRTLWNPNKPKLP